MSDDAIKLPRFPCVAALLCAACVGAAVWTWMRYSYARSFTISELRSRYRRADGRWEWPQGAYVELRHKDALVARTEATYWPGTPWNSHPSLCLVWTHVHEKGRPKDMVAVSSLGPPHQPYRGRFFYNDNLRRLEGQWFGQVSMLISRFTGASIAGLVIGTMGVFVFTVALRHWLRERRRSREEARGPSNGVERTQDA